MTTFVPTVTRPRGQRLFCTTWLVATVTTGVVAGFFLGHALILGPFLDWMLTTGNPTLLPGTYAVFRVSAHRTGFTIFFAVAGLQVLATLAFSSLALVVRSQRIPALIAGLASIGWPIVHYGSGFGGVEAAVLRSRTPAAPELVHAFLTWNVPIHIFHGTILTIALLALLWAPPSTRRFDR